MTRYAIAHDSSGMYAVFPAHRVPSRFHVDFFYLGHREAALKAAEAERVRAAYDGATKAMKRSYSGRKRSAVTYGKVIDEWDAASEPV